MSLKHLALIYEVHSRTYRLIPRGRKPLTFGTLSEAMDFREFEDMEGALVTLSCFPEDLAPEPVEVTGEFWRSLKPKAHRRVLSFGFGDIPLDKASGFVKAFSAVTGLPLDGFHALHDGAAVEFHVEARDALDLAAYESVTRHFYSTPYRLLANKMKAPGRYSGEASMRSWAKTARAPNSQVLQGEVHHRAVVLSRQERIVLDWEETLTQILGRQAHWAGLVAAEEVRRAREDNPGADGLSTPLVGCQLFAQCAGAPSEVKEDLRDDLFRIISGAPNKGKLYQAFSEILPSEVREETDARIQRAERAGPPPCSLLEERHGRCAGCEHRGKIISPSDLVLAEKWEAATKIKFRKHVGGKLVPVLDQELLQEYILHRHGRTLRATHDRHGLLRYEKNCWIETGDRDFGHRYIDPAVGVMGGGVQSTLANAYLGAILRLPAVSKERFGGLPGHIYFADRILDMRSGESIDHGPETSCGYALPFAHDEGGEEGEEDWRAYLDSTMGSNEVGRARQRTVQIFLGWALGGDIPHGGGRALYIYGGGRSGKSEFVKIITGILDRSQWAGVSVAHISEQSAWKMRNALLAIDDDESMGKKSLHVQSESTFKKIVTGGPVDMKKLFRNIEDVTLRAKILVLSNKTPSSADKSQGFYRRFSIVRFPFHFPAKGGSIHRGILERCRPAIIKWCIEGYRLLLEAGEVLEVGPDHDALMGEVRVWDDPTWGFIKERLELLPDTTPAEEARQTVVPIGELYDDFRAWLETQGVRFVPSKIAFGRRVRDILLEKRPRLHANVPTAWDICLGGHTKRCLLGVKKK